MRLSKPLVGSMLAALLGLTLVWLAHRLVAPSAVQRLLMLELNDVEGRPVPLAQWRGQPLLINFWATWCEPCREEMPLLAESAAQAGAPQVLGIAWDSAESLSDYARTHPGHYPLLRMNEAAIELLGDLGNPAKGLPFSLLVDSGGRVLSVHLGAFKPEELRKLLSQHSVPNRSKMK